MPVENSLLPISPPVLKDSIPNGSDSFMLEFYLSKCTDFHYCPDHCLVTLDSIP